MIVPIWTILGFQEIGRQNSQSLNNDTFYRPPVAIAQCVIGTDKYPHSAIFLNYDYGDCFQRYGQIKEAFKALTTEDIFNPYISDDDFR